jgi:hypothetical protein
MLAYHWPGLFTEDVGCVQQADFCWCVTFGTRLILPEHSVLQ